jgi:hypothetical protein
LPMLSNGSHRPKMEKLTDKQNVSAHARAVWI